MASKLDKKRPYGEITGEVANNARYEQDGKMFDAEGHEVAPLAEVEAALDLDARARAEADERRINAEVERRIAELQGRPKKAKAEEA